MLSAIPGRERWEIKALRKNPGLAQNLETGLLSESGVLRARCNPVTGRVLIFYSPSTLNRSVESLLRNCLKNISERAVFPRLPAGSSAPHTASLARVIKSSIPARNQQILPPLLSVVGQALTLSRAPTFMIIFKTARGEGPRFLRTLGLVKTSSQLWFMLGLSTLLSFANFIIQPYRKRSWSRLGQATQHNLRTDLLAKIETQDMTFFDTYGTGRIVRLVTQDTENIGEFVERAGDELIEKVMTIAVCGILMLLISPKLVLVGSVSLPFFLLISRFYKPRIAESYARLGEANSNFSQKLENNLGGIAEVKSFTAEDREVARLHEADAQVTSLALKASGTSTIQSQLTSDMFAMGFILAAGQGGRMVAAEELTTDEYFRAAFWFPPLLSSLTTIEDVTKLYHRASDSAIRLAEVLDSSPQIQSGPVQLKVEAARGEIVFENVSFGYDPDVKVLENVSLHLRPGETLAIVGPTGSGKSTLLNLLLRFFEVDEGQILLDGIPIKDLELRSLRSTISLVSQEGHLFEGTVRENVLFGNPLASEAQVIKALRQASALDLIKSLPGGLDAAVGERGHRLSGGERQRIALARALLKISDGASVLALDEATSHLDSETELAIKRSLRQVSIGKSVIMIAHRLATVRSANKIVVLESGRVTEEGTHEELLARKGLYATLWQIQNDDP
ncbi:MAG TPA: ABC transporter transmembrane domain-containing protein, partial [Pyrinomonadaceae bacterium]